MQYRSNNILTLVNPSEEGKLFLNQIIFFQQSLDMRIFFYHIVGRPSLFEKIFHARRTKDLKTDALVSLRCFINNLVPPAALNNMTFRVKTGHPLPILLRQSKKGGYEFILIEKNKPGSTLSKDDINRLVSRAFCPVMLCNRNHQLKKIKEIIIPVDILHSTKKKLLWATYFAKKYNARVIIVSALAFNIEEKKSLAWRNSQKLKHLLTQRGIDCELEVLKAINQEKQQVILDFINKRNPGMVIIRTHQDSSKTGTYIGKFVSDLIQGCSMPVFTVNRTKHPLPADFILHQ
ncbi:MAG: universal stress protein [Mariniphaga sp.]|nr:universal stress protein [Mariniphaga sp.]MDD4424572.1 universal stress protein [Mariniphaga sp.]